MKLERFEFQSRSKNFYVEPFAENLGIKFMECDKIDDKCIAMIIDNGEEFLLSSKKDGKLLIRRFTPTTPLCLKNGDKAPLSGEDQVEVLTPFGKKMIVRALSKEKKDTGVIIAYEKNETLWSVAIVGAPIDGLVMSLAK